MTNKLDKDQIELLAKVNPDFLHFVFEKGMRQKRIREKWEEKCLQKYGKHWRRRFR